MSRYIPLSIPNFEGNERKYVDDAIDKAWVSTAGSYVTELEKRLAQFLCIDNVSVCQSGTSALHLALVEAGVVPGDIVLVPPLTFIAAVNPVRYQFATPLFIDCDDSLCMDSEKLRRFCQEKCVMENGHLTHNGKIVRALVAVHVFGNMADMETIMEVAGRYNIRVIEDATEALGTRYTKGTYSGKYAGTIGDFGAYSFNGNKIITTGGGGAITAKKPETVDHLRYLSTQAKDDPHFYIHNEVGYNYRMTNLQAALGVAQMEKLTEFIERKHRNFDLYKKLFHGFGLGKLLPYREGTYSNQWFYSLIIDRTKVKAALKEIIAGLQEYGVETRAVWGLINEQLPYMKEECFELEKGPYYGARVLNIPASTQLTEDDIYFAAEKIKAVLEELKE